MDTNQVKERIMKLMGNKMVYKQKKSQKNKHVRRSS